MQPRSQSVDEQEEDIAFLAQINCSNPNEVFEIAKNSINRSSLTYYDRSINRLKIVHAHLEGVDNLRDALRVKWLIVDLTAERNIVARLTYSDLLLWIVISDIICDFNKVSHFSLIPTSYLLKFVESLSENFSGDPSFYIAGDLSFLITIIEKADRETRINLYFHALCGNNNLHTLLQFSYQPQLLDKLDIALGDGSDIELSPKVTSDLLEQLKVCEFPYIFPNLKPFIERVVLKKINELLQQQPNIQTLTELIKLSTLAINLPEGLAERILQLAANQPYDCQKVSALAVIARLFNKVSDPNKKVRLLLRALTQDNFLSSLCGIGMTMGLLIELSGNKDIRLDLQTKMSFIQSKNGPALLRNEKVLQRLIGPLDVDHERLRAMLFKIKELRGEGKSAEVINSLRELIVAIKRLDTERLANTIPDIPRDISNSLLSLLAYTEGVYLQSVDLTCLINKIDNKSFKTVILLRSITPGNALSHIMRPVYSSGFFFSAWAPLTMLKELIGTPLVMDKETQEAIADVLLNEDVSRKLGKEVCAWLDKCFVEYNPIFQTHIMNNDNDNLYSL